MTNIIDSTATDVTPTEPTDTLNKTAKRNKTAKAINKAVKEKAAKTKDTTFGGLVGSKKAAKEIVAERIASVSAPTSTDAIVQEANKALVAMDVSTKKNLPVSAVQTAVNNARSIHRAMKSNFIDGITQIAEQVIRAKDAAKAEGVKFDSLFGNPDDATQFPFSQNWANTIVRVYESKLLTGDNVGRLPSDLTTLATLASTKPEKREAVLRRYEEIRTGDVNFIEGEIVLAKVTTQKAMKKAKAEVDGDEGEEEAVSKKKPKAFNAMRIAKKLHAELGDDGLSELADAIELILIDAGIR